MSISRANVRSMCTSLFIGAVFIAAALMSVAIPLDGESARAGADDTRLPVRKSDAPAMPVPDPDPFGHEMPARGKFLVAGRNLADPRFRETVVLLIDFGAEGASGLIINQPTQVPLAAVLPSVPGITGRADVVYYGGPVEGRRVLMLIRAPDAPKESAPVFGDVYVSSSMNTLDRMIAAHETEKHFRAYAGYAGWLPGQLDREVARGDWLVVRADVGTIFEKKPSEIWRELYRRASAIQI